jgi:hypothetical protein
MRNSSIVSYNLSKYAYLNSVMDEVLCENNDADAAEVFHKNILHAAIVGFTLSFQKLE